MRTVDISTAPPRGDLTVQSGCLAKFVLKHPAVLRSRCGAMLVTVEGDPVDYLLAGGEELRLPSRKIVLIEGDAIFMLYRASGRRMPVAGRLAALLSTWDKATRRLRRFLPDRPNVSDAMGSGHLRKV